MLAMTRPAASSKLILIEARTGASDVARPARVRRYRLARLQLDGRSSDPASRFDHLKRVSIVRKAFAGAILVIASVLILKLVIGFVIAIFWGAVVVAAVIAVIWALKQIVW
jgi:hypothetical protein